MLQCIYHDKNVESIAALLFINQFDISQVILSIYAYYLFSQPFVQFYDVIFNHFKFILKS